jgi:dihydropteroate synthase
MADSVQGTTEIGRHAPDFLASIKPNPASADGVHIMGILNITPDSFSDGGGLMAGNSACMDRVRRLAEEMVCQGASILDVGGESTRPGAAAVSEQQELDRVIPVIEALAGVVDTLVSIDTSNPSVMRAAVAAGAGLINDVRALGCKGSVVTAVALQKPVCLMHMQGVPGSMQQQPDYHDVVLEVERFLLQRARELQSAGLPSELIAIDPGFGFGKNLQHNLQLFNGLGRLCAGDYPVLVGVSRKSMIGKLTGREVGQRVVGSATLAALAVSAGARIVRVHDVAATADAVRIAIALKEQVNVT